MMLLFSFENWNQNGYFAVSFSGVFELAFRGRIFLQNLGEKAPDFSRGDESPESLFESMVYK